jgi:hypothetical protein
LRAPQGRAAWPLKADALALEACGSCSSPRPRTERGIAAKVNRACPPLSVTTSYGRVTRSKRAARRPSTFSAGTAGSSLAMTAKERGSICQGALENGAGVVVKMVGDDTPADLSLS